MNGNSDKFGERTDDRHDGSLIRVYATSMVYAILKQPIIYYI